VGEKRKERRKKRTVLIKNDMAKNIKARKDELQ
jgi:hypothetical protein